MTNTERSNKIQEMIQELEQAAHFLRVLLTGNINPAKMDFYEQKFGYLDDGFYFEHDGVVSALYCESCGRFLNRKLECSECQEWGEAVLADLEKDAV